MPRKGKSKRVKKVAKAVAKVITGHGAYHVGGKAGRSKRSRRSRAGGVRGHGSYFVDKAADVVGGLASKATRWLGDVFGMGAYKVRQNTLMTDNGPPMFNGGEAGFEFAHREFLFDLSTSVAFAKIGSIVINPGNPAFAPLLSRIALNFEEYDLLGCIYEFKTNSGTAVASTNTALGTMVIATNYDVLDHDFTTKQEAEAYMFATSCVPCASMIHPVECASRQNVLSRLYVKNPQVPLDAAADPRFYHVGKTQFFSGGAQAASVAGEVWVSYHLRLYKPKLPSIGDIGLTAYKSLNQTGVATSTTFGTVANAVIQTSGNLSSDITITQASGGVSNLTFAQTSIGAGTLQGRYFYINVLWGAGTSVTFTGLMSATGGSAFLVQNWWGVTTPIGNQVQVGSGGVYATTEAVVTTTTNVTFAVTMPQVTVVGTNPFVVIQVYEIPANFTFFNLRIPIEQRLAELESRFAGLLKEASIVDNSRFIDISDAESPPECKDEADLEKSVHISRDEVKRLLRLTK